MNTLTLIFCTDSLLCLNTHELYGDTQAKMHLNLRLLKARRKFNILEIPEIWYKIINY
jgi:hypothetical protein